MLQPTGRNLQVLMEGCKCFSSQVNVHPYMLLVVLTLSCWLTCRYYYNKVTKQSKWEMPAELKVPKSHSLLLLFTLLLCYVILTLFNSSWLVKRQRENWPQEHNQSPCLRLLLHWFQLKNSMVQIYHLWHLKELHRAQFQWHLLMPLGTQSQQWLLNQKKYLSQCLLQRWRLLSWIYLWMMLNKWLLFKGAMKLLLIRLMMAQPQCNLIRNLSCYRKLAK